MKPKHKLWLLLSICIILIALFLLIGINGSWDYAFPRRVQKTSAMLLVGFCIALSTVIFQTMTNNRILTPSIIGLDSLYVLLQTAIVFLFGSTSTMILNKNLNFILSIVCMVIFSILLYFLLFMRGRTNLYFLLLVGIVFGTLFQSISSFMQALIDPNEFLVVQNKLFASFNKIEMDLLMISFVMVLLVLLYFYRFSSYLDTLSLGKDHAINLGVPYQRITINLMAIVAVLISISTALVGPITFLGLLTANITYHFLKTYQHKFLITGTILMSMITLLAGQLIVERVFTFTVTISVIINFVGGVYFLYLLLKENRSW